MNSSNCSIIKKLKTKKYQMGACELTSCNPKLAGQLKCHTKPKVMSADGRWVWVAYTLHGVGGLPADMLSVYLLGKLWADNCFACPSTMAAAMYGKFCEHSWCHFLCFDAEPHSSSSNKFLSVKVIVAACRRRSPAPFWVAMCTYE